MARDEGGAFQTNLRAAFLLAAATSLFTTNDAIIKLLSARLPLGEILFVRGWMIIAILLVAMHVAKEELRPQRLLLPLNLGRAALEVCVTFTFLAGVVRLPLATATTLIFTAPIFLTLTAFFFLGEKVGPRRWAAVVAGFVGVVLIADPGTGLDPAMLLPLAAAALSAARDTATRMIGTELPARAIALSTATAVMLAGLATAPLGGWIVPDSLELAGLVACAFLLAISYTLLVSAIRAGEMSFMAPFRYVSILWALAFGFLIWGYVPAMSALLGALVIVGSGLFIFYRERALARRDAAGARP